MYNSDLSIYEVSVGGMSTVVRMSNNFNIIHLTLSKMVIRPVDGFKAIHRRRVRQSKQMSFATNTSVSDAARAKAELKEPQLSSDLARARSSQYHDMKSHLSINPSQKSWNKEKESSFSVTHTVFLWIRAKEPYQKERDYQKGRNQADKKFHTQGGERTSQISLLQTSHKGRMLENDSVLFDV